MVRFIICFTLKPYIWLRIISCKVENPYFSIVFSKSDVSFLSPDYPNHFQHIQKHFRIVQPGLKILLETSNIRFRCVKSPTNMIEENNVPLRDFLLSATFLIYWCDKVIQIWKNDETWKRKKMGILCSTFTFTCKQNGIPGP